VGIWLGNYVQLQNEITYFNFKLERLVETEEEKLRVSKEIKIREQQAKEFLLLVDSFVGLERDIILKIYVEHKKYREIAEELNFSINYIKLKVVEIKRSIKLAERLLGERNKEIK